MFPIVVQSAWAGFCVFMFYMFGLLHFQLHLRRYSVQITFEIFSFEASWLFKAPLERVLMVQSLMHFSSSFLAKSQRKRPFWPGIPEGTLIIIFNGSEWRACSKIDPSFLFAVHSSEIRRFMFNLMIKGKTSKFC